MATFASSTAIKRMLGIPSTVTTHDDAISDLLNAVDQIVLDELNLDAAASTTYTDKLDVTDNGQTMINTTKRPVLTVAALTVGGSAYTEGTDYKIDKSLGMITLMPMGNFLPVGREQVEITYTAGFSSVPADLIYAGNLIACSMFNQQSHVGFASERAGDYTYSLGKGVGSSIPSLASRILNKHRRLFARGAT